MNGAVLLDEAGVPLLLRGVAVPFHESIVVDAEPEAFSAEAFEHRGALAQCVLQWDHAEGSMHFAAVADGTLALHRTAMALMFECHLPAHPIAQGVARVARSGQVACSISFTPEARRDGTITAAKLDHIAVTTGETCYATTCWLEDSTTRYPRLGADAERWRRHLNLHLRGIGASQAPG